MKVDKIFQRAYNSGATRLVKKVFQRGLQTIECKSAYAHNKLYFRSWRIDEYNKTREISQAYRNGKPIKNSRSILNFFKK